MRASASNAQDLGMPAIYLHLLAELLHTIGVDERDLLLRVGLDPLRLNSTDLRVSQSQASEFVTRAIIESGEPGLGIMLARELKMPLHGALGTAVMSSRTLEEALELMTRYLTLRAPHLHVTKRRGGSNAWYTVACDMDLGPLQGFIMDAMLFGCIFMGAQLTGAIVEGSRVLRRGPEPAYFHRFRQLMPVPVEYGATEDALVIPVSQLDLPIRFSDEQLAATSRSQCEEALRQLTEDAGFACRVRRVIETSHPFPPKLARVAATLFVSERTLKRRLQEEEASFQALVDRVRLERAGELLTNTGMNLSQIADALGYADAANFTRAFKRWTGTSPSQYRNHTRRPQGIAAKSMLTATV
ncbi:AraC family transcriptional regulator [Marinobacter sp. M216]|uniref:AraC family transcriptional regulator n=1 Tax=Marinobacter albus TaxID=3030833 RepID=A0ABT7HEY9_9GAMM|nr:MULTISPECIES: AraC family transcriptional regulator [unclassified Marinobacter]MBW7471855.1 AraC family transcriptional regulator [Marinobacter sp. F4218]MDK9558425.1 AraC family transcriptional regulator [Marinobacter sp. M216]